MSFLFFLVHFYFFKYWIISEGVQFIHILKSANWSISVVTIVPSEKDLRLCNSDHACKGRSMKCKNNCLDISITTLRPLWRFNLNSIKIHINKRLSLCYLSQSVKSHHFVIVTANIRSPEIGWHYSWACIECQGKEGSQKFYWYCRILSAAALINDFYGDSEQMYLCL